MCSLSRALTIFVAVVAALAVAGEARDCSEESSRTMGRLRKRMEQKNCESARNDLTDKDMHKAQEGGNGYGDDEMEGNGYGNFIVAPIGGNSCCGYGAYGDDGA
jgi:hypothetical protein